MNISKPEESAVFRLIIDAKKALQEKTIVMLLFQTVYIIELVCIFVIVLNHKDNPADTYLKSFMLLISLVIVTVVIVVEIFVAFVWNVHLQLYNQMLFYRYTVVPLIMLFLAS